MPDPQRLVDVYNSSAATLNLVRAFVTGGYADLRQVHTWNTDFVRESPVGQRYEQLAAEIDRALTFMQAIGADPDEFHRVDFHTCHEALLLDYEHALTRIDSRTEHAVRRLRRTSSGSASAPASSTARTSSCSATSATRSASSSARPPPPTTRSRWPAKLNPDNEPGRLTFITRFGAGKIRDGLPDLVEKVTAVRRRGGLGLRPDARQHLRGVLGLQDPPLRRRHRRGPGLLRRAPLARHLARRRPRRAHRRRRHRVRRRRRGARRDRPRPRATSRSATRGSTGSSRWSWPSSSRRCCARPDTGIDGP